MATTFYKLLDIDYPIIALSCYRDGVAAASLAHEATRAAVHRNEQYRFGHDSGVNDVDRSANGVFVHRSSVVRTSRLLLEGHLCADPERLPFLDIPVNRKAAA